MYVEICIILFHLSLMHLSVYKRSYEKIKPIDMNKRNKIAFYSYNFVLHALPSFYLMM